MEMIITMILWMLMGVATAYLANNRGRDPYIWFALGIFLGLLAMLALILLPPVKSDEEQAIDEKNKEIIDRREKQVEEEEKIENAPDLLPQSVETKEWFYMDKSHQQQGPASFFLINELWESGDINVETLVWTEGMSDWNKIVDVSDLHEVLVKLESENRKAFPEDL
ncbi:MAG TPA: DUF4339 domain-containing protein [Parachlamydiaceae bacterium]|nr:DUF4339 domain-containing protein [Parachlamydiaceae bacterium]